MRKNLVQCATKKISHIQMESTKKLHLKKRMKQMNLKRIKIMHKGAPVHNRAIEFIYRIIFF